MTVNNLVASCLSEECSYKYTRERTPTVSQVSSNTGETGAFLTINGTGFSSNRSHVTVTVGNVGCFVNTSSENQITFTLGKRESM